MNVFVTGGAGYIGSATAEALLKAGHSVTDLRFARDRLPGGRAGGGAFHPGGPGRCGGPELGSGGRKVSRR